MTKYPDLFNRLMEPFHPDNVRSRTGTGGKNYDYLTARSVMNRLDDACGPEAWWDDYVASEKSVLCRLTIRLPDGTQVTKCDVGGFAGMSDTADDEKSGYSDAFKRAAVKFGIGRYLYKEGFPIFGPAPEAAVEPTPQAPPTTKPKDTRSYWQMICDAKERRSNVGGDDYSSSDVHWMLVVMAADAKKITIPTSNVTATSLASMEKLYAAEPRFVIDALIQFVGKKIAPNHIDRLFEHEREGGKPLPDDRDLSTFLYAETTMHGRGNREDAIAYLCAELKTDKEGARTRFALPATRSQVLDSLRRYLDDHPTTLPPIKQGAAA